MLCILSHARRETHDIEPVRCVRCGAPICKCQVNANGICAACPDTIMAASRSGVKGVANAAGWARQGQGGRRAKLLGYRGRLDLYD